MIRQTGGRAFGATSTRSSPASRALRSASAVLVEPIFCSCSSIRKIGEILICSLCRKFVEMAYLSKKEPNHEDAKGRRESSHKDDAARYAKKASCSIDSLMNFFVSSVLRGSQ
jgi:hypothetical protein